MKMTKLAFLNFKNSLKSYLSLIISMSFAILVFYNFQNITYSEMFTVLGEHNKSYIDILVRVICFVLGCFLFFYIWYATNVFLTKRKKEIGIYVFMGLSNQKIGKLYMLETTFIGISALITGIGIGAVVQGLFQMILCALSELDIEVSLRITYQPALITAAAFLAIYGIFMLKGYVNIIKSSVLDMISASRQNEYVRQNGFFLLVKAVFGVCVICRGYYYAVKDGGIEVMENLLLAVILVTAGVYLLFSGLLPLIFQNMVGNKKFLYHGQRLLWVNQVVFRMKKNYRTYAIVCIMLLSSVSALAAGFAMKNRYENMMRFDKTYTFQLVSIRPDLQKEAEGLLEGVTDISYQNACRITSLRGGEENQVLIVPYSDAERMAEQAGLSFDLEEPAADEVISVKHLVLMSFLTKPVKNREIQGKEYRQIETTSVPYFGYFQKQFNFYIVGDEEYGRLEKNGEENYMYNYKIADDNAFLEAQEALDVLVSDGESDTTAMFAVDPDADDIEWIKVLSALCVFMFLVFIVAGGCIMFMRLYNDAFEEKERYRVMLKIGFGQKALEKSVKKELGTAYLLPLVVMAVSAYFSVHALERLMQTTLISTYAVSMLVVGLIFLLCYAFSVAVYTKTLMRY